MPRRLRRGFLYSIRYEKLPSYFLVFGVWEGQTLLDFDEMRAFCEELERQSGENVPLVPTLFRGLWNEKTVRGLFPRASVFGGECEGYVVRLAGRIAREDWPRHAGKYVRPHHVQTGPHWMMKPVEKNGLASGK